MLRRLAVIEPVCRSVRILDVLLLVNEQAVFTRRESCRKPTARAEVWIDETEGMRG